MKTTRYTNLLRGATIIGSGLAVLAGIAFMVLSLAGLVADPAARFGLLAPPISTVFGLLACACFLLAIAALQIVRQLLAVSER